MKNILIVDDEESIRDMLAHTISLFGHKPYTASNGAEAIDILLRKPDIDIVLLDLVMPGMNGYEVGNALKNLKPDIDIIISSATAINTAEKRLDALGVRHILHKPYPLTELQRIIDECL